MLEKEAAMHRLTVLIALCCFALPANPAFASPSRN